MTSDREISVLAVADSYRDSLKLVNAAEIEVVRVDAIWKKVHRVKQYLEAQAKAELEEVLS